VTPDRWSQLRAFFHQAQDKDESDWSGVLAKLRAEDPEICAELESLLAEQPPPHFLDSPWPILNEEIVPRPDRVGPYTITREIGRGGMGVVFEAVREDEETRQTVAIKVLTSPLLDTEYARRVRLERQVLNRLDHPGIGRLVDWGVTSTGHAYLVMEYVRDAQPIDRYCAAANASISDILVLFVQVCDAVAHAHRHLVVHRDLKPGNILVTSDGRPKLLDFGIAKLLDSVDEATVTTARRLTPAYASPEQVRGEPVTTASDVYSLGVLLFELLTGVLPYRNNGERTDALAWSVGNDDCPRASETTGLSRQRAKALRGDLDNILSKALEKNADVRYLSAEALAADIQNYLDGQPVTARNHTRWYRARKAILRNRVAFASASLAAISLVAGSGAAVWNGRAAERERATAVRRFRDLQELSRSLIFNVHDSIADLPGATNARQVLVSTAIRYLDGLDVEKTGDDALKFDIASAYKRVGDIQGAELRPNLGHPEDAAKSYAKARRLALAQWNHHLFDPARGELLFAVEETFVRLERDTARAVAMLDQDIAMAERWVSARPAEVKALRALSGLNQAQGTCWYRSGNPERTLKNADRSIQLLQLALTLDAKDWHNFWDMESGLVLRACALIQKRDPDQALQTLDMAHKYLLLAMGISPENVNLQRSLAMQWMLRSDCLMLQGKNREAASAVPVSIRLLELNVKADAEDFNSQQDLADAFYRYGLRLTTLGQKREAVEAFNHAVVIGQRLSQNSLHDRRGISGYLKYSDQLGSSLLLMNSAAATVRAEKVFSTTLEMIEPALKQTPGDVSLLVYRAKAYQGIGSALLQHAREYQATTERQRLEKRATLMLKNAVDGWHDLRRDRPDYRGGQEQQRAAEMQLARSLNPTAEKKPHSISTSGTR
jgi:non-specific serine/threonine protein kinase/serine/threonine-protein kinase